MKLVITVEVPGGRERDYQRTVATVLQLTSLRMLTDELPEHGVEKYSGDATLHYHVTFGDE